MSKNTALLKQFLPQFAGTLLGLMVLLPTAGSANTLMGIVRSPENSDEWNQIITRIRATGISYQPIDLSQINTLADLSGIKIIFLPNVENLTQTQVEIFQEWVKQGGRLIASGQVGRKSQPGVRQKLRSLLGSYWAFPLSQPTTPEARYRCLDIACKESTTWVPIENNQGIVEGGVLIPAGLNSSTAAIWKGSSGSSAVVTTPQATYFGWHWGRSDAATLDSAWLQATLNRYQGQPQFRAENSNPLPSANSNYSNPVKIRPQTSPPATAENFNTNQPATTTQGSTPDNIWIRSQQQNNQDRAKAESETSTTANSNNVWQRFRNQIDQQNEETETLSNNDTTVSSRDSPPETTTNRGGSFWNRFREQQAQNEETETLSNNETTVTATENLTPETTTNNRGGIWNRFRNQTRNTESSNQEQQEQIETTTSSSRRNPITALLRPVVPPDVQVPSGRDLSSESAPPGLDVRQGNYPISRGEAYAMLQELNNLLGRFESAMVAAKSANLEVNLATDGSSLVAANTDNTTFVAQSNRSISKAQQVITKARQVIQNFPQQVASKQYATARSQWLQTRQMLWENYPTDGERAGAEIRAVWLDRGTIVRARSKRGLAMVFDRLAAAGINTVFFETINAGYTIYPSNIAPKQNPLTIGWDPLEAAVKLARERNMEIHAWMWVFAVGNQAHNRVLNQPDSYLGPVISAHPSWVMTDNRGRQRNPSDTKVYMDPANPYVRQYLLKVIDEIASRYQVDGIQLDYIRYPFQNPERGFSYGYSTTARQQFQKLYGVDPMKISPRDRQMWWKWTEFKINQVNTFVADASKFLKQKYPKIILSAAVFPFPRYQRFEKIQQDWETWAMKGDIDLLTPMTYAMDTNRFQQITQPLTDSRVLGSTLIAPAVKLLNIPEIVAVDQIQAARDLPAGGYIIFAAERITSGLHGFLTRTQGSQETKNNRQASLNAFASASHVVEGPIPYRQPFAAAADRFQALKKEWTFLLANKQLSIGQSQLESWRSDAEELATVLNQLAENPDSSNLNHAKRSLRKFQLQFRSSMRDHARENAYQVQTWQNRLTSLEMLLNYGERVRLNSKRW